MSKTYAARYWSCREVRETTLGEDTKDPTTHWDSEKIGRED